jgi:choline dehydrogenase-like flavoprotein
MNGRIFEYNDLTRSEVVRAEVCVVGSGCGGATVAKCLAAAGHDVVILERGGYYPTRSFDQDELNMNAKLSDNRSLKTASDNTTVLLSGHNVGGASVHYWADSYRTPADRLQLWAERYGVAGHGLVELSPAWDEISAALHIHPAEDEYFNRMSELVRDGSRKLGWRGDRVPQARHNCQKSGHCMQGCVYEAKKSQLVTHIPAALALGARLYADVRAAALTTSAGRVTSLHAEVIDRPSGRPGTARLTVEAKAFVVAAGGYNSAALLMRNGFGRQLPKLGHGFGFNPSPMVHAVYDEDIVLWRNIPAAYGVDHFRLASYAHDGSYLEGGYLLMPNQLQPGLLAASIPLLGAEHAHWMQRMRRIGSTIGWIDDHPDELGHIELNDDGSSRVVYPYGPTTSAMLRDLIKKQAQLHLACDAREILVAGARALRVRGSKDLDAIDSLEVRAGGLLMGSPHPSGGCAMGRTAHDSVVDSSHRVHGFSNLFVADSSVFPTAVSVDPSLTIMGFSYLAARHIVDALR